MVKDGLGNDYPVINEEGCLNCGKCKRFCPALNPIDLMSPIKSFVGYSCGEKKSNIENYVSSSGGIAKSLYLYCLDNGISYAGVYISDSLQALMKFGNSIKDIKSFCGSKYMYSKIDSEFYMELEKKMKDNEKILFIGLPCQCAAVRKKTNDSKQIILVDIICHGVCSEDYIRNYANEKFENVNINNVQFRDPNFREKGEDFVFSFYNSDNKRIYHKGVNSTDIYQIAYHKALDYRENCFYCRYAQFNRVGDITIGDYFCIGKLQEYNGKTKGISLVISNSKRGEELLLKLEAEGYIDIIERNIEEARIYVPQLNSPSKKHKKRDVFLKIYSKTHNFSISAKKALKSDIIYNYIRNDIIRFIWHKIKR